MFVVFISCIYRLPLVRVSTLWIGYQGVVKATETRHS